MPDNRAFRISIPKLFTKGDSQAEERIVGWLIKLGACHDLATSLPWLATHVPGLAGGRGGKGYKILKGEVPISLAQFDRLMVELRTLASQDGSAPPSEDDIAGAGWSA